jgi:hypothetical protein
MRIRYFLTLKDPGKVLLKNQNAEDTIASKCMHNFLAKVWNVIILQKFEFYEVCHLIQRRQ